ncbi:MAG: hypothetical protein PHC33_04445, partial [Candidatus Omnitrophica bacterium]|nr:hypothetical protein [Candidatus Omnitrophota bacterium]
TSWASGPVNGFYLVVTTIKVCLFYYFSKNFYPKSVQNILHYGAGRPRLCGNISRQVIKQIFLPASFYQNKNPLQRNFARGEQRIVITFISTRGIVVNPSMPTFYGLKRDLLWIRTIFSKNSKYFLLHLPTQMQFYPRA